MFNSLRHLLPRGRAWRLTPDKALRRFFEGVANGVAPARDFIDETWQDIFPDTTRELDAWEEQFALWPSASLSEIQRRQRLDAAWKTVGGQSPRYIRDTLLAAGFDVYVHEWWDPSAVAPAPSAGDSITMGEATALQGEPGAVMGDYGGGGGGGVRVCVLPRNPNDYVTNDELLVNKVYSSSNLFTALAGDVSMHAGGATAVAGYYEGFVESEKVYTIPTNPQEWHYFIYLGGATFPSRVSIPLARKNEFEALCLKICPAHLWIGLLIDYV